MEYLHQKGDQDIRGHIDADLREEVAAAAGPVGSEGHVERAGGVEGAAVGHGLHADALAAGLGHIYGVMEAGYGVEVIGQSHEGPAFLVVAGIDRKSVV